MEEHKVGEIFQFEGKTLKCVKSVDNYCLKCALRSHILCDEYCAPYERSDNQNVIFIEVKGNYETGREITNEINQ